MSVWGHGMLGLEQSYDDSPTTLQQAKDAGARIWRTTADMRSGDVADRLYQCTSECARLGLKVMVCATYTPTDLGNYKQVPVTALNRGIWADRVGVLAARFKGKVAAWEIWNEGNNGGDGGFNYGSDVVAYSDLLRRSYASIKAADPAALVVTTGTSPHGTNATGVSPIDWTVGLYQNGPPACDAFGHHPYSFPWPASHLADWNAAQQTYRMSQVIAWCDAHLNRPARPIWGTEVAFPSYKTTRPSDLFVSEKDQIGKMADLVQLWRSWSFTGPLFWYGVRDNAQAPPTNDPPAWGGLRRFDGSEKPVLPWFKALAEKTPA